MLDAVINKVKFGDAEAARLGLGSGISQFVWNPRAWQWKFRSVRG